VRKRASRSPSGAGVGWEAAHLDAIDELVCRDAAGEIAIDVDVRLVRSYDQLDLAAPPHHADAAEAIEAPPGCEIRGWLAGDRMRPARLKGRSRKLSDLYADAKVPKSIRAAARVIVRSADSVILWAEHVGIAHESVLLDGERQKLVAIPTRTVGSF
jgi:tRNA(Ile)-lysidine synthase